MSSMEWDEDLSVNVSEIDKEHQLLVGMLNELNDAMRWGKGKAVVGNIIEGLISYAGSHFRNEEKYFDMFNYPKAISHKKEHSDFVAKVCEFRTGFEKGKLGLTIEVLFFLSDWLRKHIKGSDKEYGPFFNANGLK
jgi:hemerythrin